MAEAGKCEPLVLTSEDLRQYTNDFSQENLLVRTQFGKLYRGKIVHGSNQMESQEVTVKTWEDVPRGDPQWIAIDPDDNGSRLTDEVYFLQLPSVKNHKSLVNLIGYSREGEPLGVVYDLKPRDTLHNLILEDAFTWLQRIKAVLGFARLLAFLHDNEPPYIVRNIDAAHVMIDQNSNPILFDFGMLSGGIMGDMTNNPHEHLYGAIGYIDRQLCTVGGWTVKCDVYSFGVLLMSLIAKRVINKTNPVKTGVADWAEREYKPKKSLFKRKPKCSLVHNSFEEDPDYDARDGPIITELAMRCLEYKPTLRPTMRKIVECLQALRIVRNHGEAVGI